MALIAWYKFDGNANDSSGNDKHLLNVTATPNQNGKIGSCYNFDANQYISSTTGFDFPATTSVSAWGYNTTIVNMMLFSFDSPSWSGTDLYFHSNTIFWNIGDGAGNPFKKNGIEVSQPSTNQWHHYVVTNNQFDNTATLYIDGIFWGTAEFRSTEQINRGFVIGNYVRGDTNYAWRGFIDDVRIYDNILSLKEIKELSKAKILHYSFDNFQEPTENEIPLNRQTFENWTSHQGASITLTQNISVPEWNTTKATRIQSSGGTSVIKYYQGMWGVSTNGTYYAFQVKVKNQGNSNIKIDHNNPNLLGENILAPNETKTCYGVVLGNGVNGHQLRFTTVNVNDSIDIIAFEPQMELKDHCTLFTPTTRQGIIRDSSGYGNDANLVLSTTPRWVEDGKIGKGAYEFDGINSFITRENLSDYFRNNPLTMTAWIKTSGLKPNMVGGGIVSISYGVTLYLDATGRLVGRAHEDTFFHINGTSNLFDDKWHLVSYVYDGSFIRIYVDGIQENQEARTLNSLWSGLFAIGHEVNNPSTHKFWGLIDDVRIYATALSESDIKELYQTRAQLDDKGNLFVNDVSEKENLAFRINRAIKNKSFTDGLYHYVQANCQVTLTDNGYRIYRPPNLTYPDAGNTMWGGLRVELEKSGFQLQKGRKYRISFRVSGVSSNGTYGVKFSNNMGWDGFNYGLTNSGFSKTMSLPSNFNGTIKIVAETNILDDIYKICTESYSSFTAGNYYNCYRDLCFGFVYSSTGSLGTDIYITDFEVQDITDSNNFNVSNKGIIDSLEISELGPTNGLVAYYPLNGNAKDYAGNNNGTVVGATIDTGIDGKLCYEFDGAVDKYIKCAHKPINPTSHTISGWFMKRSHSISNFPIFLSYGLPYIACDSSLSPFRVSYTGSTQVNVIGTTIPQLNEWYHVIAVFNTNGVHIYVNGNHEGTNSILCTNTGATFDLGRHLNSNEYRINGKIQNVRIYNRALTDDEIKILYDLERPNAPKMKLSKDCLYINGEIKEI